MGRKRSEPRAEELEGVDGSETDTQKACTAGPPGSVAAVEYHLSYARAAVRIYVHETRNGCEVYVTENGSRPNPGQWLPVVFSAGH